MKRNKAKTIKIMKTRTTIVKKYFQKGAKGGGSKVQNIRFLAQKTVEP